MFINHDVCNLSSDSNLLSAQSNEQLLMAINKLGCSWSSSNIDSSNCNSCNNYNSSCFTPWLSSTTMPYDRPYRLPETDRLEDMQLLQSVKKLNVLQDNALDNKTSNPLDYSLHSQINEHHSSAFTTLISPSLPQTKHNFSRIPNIRENNDCDLSFPWTLNYDVESKNCMSNIEANSGRSLKRKYSESSSNITRKYSQKYMRSEFNKTVVSTDDNNNGKDTVNKNTISNSSQLNNSNHSPTSEITNSASPMIKNFADKSLNSSGRKKFKSDKDIQLNNTKSMNTPTSSTAVPSSMIANTGINCSSDVSINDSDNKSGNKSGTVTTAAYKYLTWREKDRRRRFREEWKHLWLVIPHGLYEVMCLVCHKVMTQRKLDTIKRHTVRRHAELLKMPESDRQELFDQLFKQHNNNNNMLGESNTNSLTNEIGKIHQKSSDTCKSNSKKSSRSTSNIQGSNEASNNLSNYAPRWSNNKMTETTSVTNLSRSNSIPSKYTPSHYVPHKRDFCSKSSQISDTTPEYTRNFFTNKGRSPSKIPIEEMIDEILNKIPVNLRKQWQDHLELTENIPTNQFLDYKNPLDNSIYSNSYQKEIVNRHQFTPESSVPSTIISSPISSKISPIQCSSHLPISYITPHISKLENSSKSFPTTNFRQRGLSTQSSPIPLFLSPNIHNLDDISNFEKINPNVNKNIKNRNTDRNNFTANFNLNSTAQEISSSSSKSIHNNSVLLCSDSQCNSITNHFIDDFQKTVQNKPSESLLNRVDFSLNQTSAPQTSVFSNITGTTESQTLMLASWFTTLMNAAKTSNQPTTYEKTSPDLFKPIWNNLSSMEKPSPLRQQFPNSELFNANPCDSYSILQQASYLNPCTDSKVNSEGKETINSCKKSSDSQTSVNSDLNKFTISSLLSTNSRETTKSIATLNKESSHHQSDISNKQKTSICSNNTRSDDQHDDICKMSKLKSISDYFESLFYGFNEKKHECSPHILDQIRAYKLNIDLLTKFLTKQINGHYDFTEIRDSFNFEELEAKIRQHGANEFQAESQKTLKLPHIQQSQDLGTVEDCMRIYYSEIFRNQFNDLQMNYDSNHQPPAAGCILVEGENNFRPKN